MENSACPSESEVRRSVVDNAGACPFCGWSPTVEHVIRVGSREYGEAYYGIACADCQARYDDDCREWVLPSPPGEPSERVSAV